MQVIDIYVIYYYCNSNNYDNILIIIGAITELAARYKTDGGAFDFVNVALGKRYYIAYSYVNLYCYC